MPERYSAITDVDGSLDFSAGVNSIKVSTIASQRNPNGLARNELAWLINATVRDGGILPRNSIKDLGRVFGSSSVFDGGTLYYPDFGNPYFILSISGHLWKLDPDNLPALVDLSASSGLTLPVGLDRFFSQAEKYLVIQAGDNVSLPLFWDGATLRTSNGLQGNPKELPPATAMDYYMGRLWYAQGRTYSAGDIVGSHTSGTLINNYRDSVLRVTENPLAIGGDGFTIPSGPDTIRALFHNANLNSPLGQGQLFIGTRRAVYALQVPVTRNDWIAANTSNQPLQTVVQLVNGPVNDRSVVPVNGDIFYQSLEPSIRSLFAAIRYFNQWGNIPLSSNEQRILKFNDRSLLHAASGIMFDNRLLQTALPKKVPQGVVHQGIIPLDFVPMNQFGSNQNPAWEGMLEGLDILNLYAGDFGGLERGFALAVSRTDQSIHLWEMTTGLGSDVIATGEGRVIWVIETPAFTWNDEFALKKLVGMDLWVDKLLGEVIFRVEYRPDSDPCWHQWQMWTECQARNSCEDAIDPVCYPLTGYGESFRSTMTLAKPLPACESATGRPNNVGYQFQLRITVKGQCRIRGFMIHAEPVERKLYQNIVC